MAERSLPPEELKVEPTKLVNRAFAAMNSGIKHLAEAERQRAERLKAAGTRLEAHLGEDHPQVVRLKRKAAAADASQIELTTMAERQALQPEIEVNDWIVYGRVLDPKGEPVSGVKVRLDKDEQYASLLGDALTGKYGDFALVYHEQDLEELRQNDPELYLMVTDTEAKPLFTSHEGVRCELGRAEYFFIRLPERPKKRKRNAITRKTVRKKAKGR